MKRHSESGLTLIEVVVALLLLSIALMGLAVGFPSSRGAVYMGDQLSTAVNLAQQTLEQMRNSQYNEATDEITAANFPANEAYGTILDFPNFRRNVLIENGVPQAACVPPPGTPCTKRVTVSVFYRDNSGQEPPVPVALTTVFVR